MGGPLVTVVFRGFTLVHFGTGDDWSILDSSCGSVSVCEGIHSMDGKEVLAPDTSFTRTESKPT